MKRGNNTPLLESWCNNLPGREHKGVKHKQFGSVNCELIFICSWRVKQREYSGNVQEHGVERGGIKRIERLRQVTLWEGACIEGLSSKHQTSEADCAHKHPLSPLCWPWATSVGRIIKKGRPGKKTHLFQGPEFTQLLQMSMHRDHCEPVNCVLERKAGSGAWSPKAVSFRINIGRGHATTLRSFWNRKDEWISSFECLRTWSRHHRCSCWMGALYLLRLVVTNAGCLLES